MPLQTAAAITAPRRPAAAWPDAVSYREAIQNPTGVLSAPEMQSAQVVLDRRSLPLTYSGRFAVVFRLRTNSGDWAVRCFTQAANDQERRERYRAIAGRLAEAGGAHFVPFRYIERGIRIGAEWFPVVLMRWAEGETLGRWIEKNLHNPAALLRLAATLTALLGDLERAGIAHGDWQHDNLLVSETGDHVTLVDYDGMFVPELAGQPSRELGHPNYQHPARTAQDYAAGLDRFSCLVLQTALVALAQNPALWSRFNDGESILFRRGDFADPARSPVFGALRALAGRDPGLDALRARLERVCRAGRAGVFAFEESRTAAASAPRHDGEYLHRLTRPETLRAERWLFRLVRAALLLWAGSWAAVPVWGMGHPGMRIVLSIQLLAFVWFTYAGRKNWYWEIEGEPGSWWPRKRIHDELIRQMQDEWEMLGRCQDEKAALRRKMPVDPGDLAAFTRARFWAGVPAEKAAEEHRRIVEQRQQTEDKIARLERLTARLECQLEDLARDRDAFPDVSFAAYLRRLLGRDGAP